MTVRRPRPAASIAAAVLLAASIAAFSAASVATAGASGTAEAASTATPAVRSVSGGKVQGLALDGVHVWRGIPFVAPPVGPLRWRAPQPVVPWQGVRDATQFGPACPQPNLFYDVPQSEDCLTLNIWAAPGARKAPVLVWIHGGGFINSSSTQPATDGTELAKRGIVVVAANYRLGALGMFAHPALAREAAAAGEPTGNFGILDQIAALKWVRDNIARFGGDPSNVTVSGVSAGGTSSLILVQSPLARGLFTKAIVQSAGGTEGVQTLAQAEAAGVAFAAEFGDAAGDPARLRDIPAKDIVAKRGFPMTERRQRMLAGNEFGGQYEAVQSRGGAEGMPTKPFVDGKVLVKDLGEAYGAAEVASVRMIIGATNGESGGQGGATDRIEARGAMAAALGRAEGVAKAGGKAWLYYFTYSPGRGPAPHGAAMPYTFGNLGKAQGNVDSQVFARTGPTSGQVIAGNRERAEGRGERRRRTSAEIPPAMAADRQAVADALLAYWVSFMRDGRPAADGKTAWPDSSPGDPRALLVDGPAPRLVPVRTAPAATAATDRRP